ncbi:MAG TPA: DUF4359 domain-containing protein [Trichocoleus sp.]
MVSFWAKAKTTDTRNWVAWISGLTLGSLTLGGMAITNPPLPAYEAYAVAQISTYAESQLCQDIPAALQFLQGQCSDLLRQHQTALQNIIHERTQRHNFLLFSLYETTFAIPGLEILPAYQVNTLGIFNQFFIYRATQR